MKIQPGNIEQLADAWNILQACKHAMESQGIFQWTTAYPNAQTVEKDIRAGELYCLFMEGRCAGIITLNEEQDAEYKTVSWQCHEGEAMVVHRLAVHPQYQQQGIAGMLMDFAEQLAAEKKYASIRLDAYAGNPRALRFYENRSYVKRGEVFFPGRSIHFHCYEKII